MYGMIEEWDVVFRTRRGSMTRVRLHLQRDFIVNTRIRTPCTNSAIDDVSVIFWAWRTRMEAATRKNEALLKYCVHVFEV